MRFNKVPTRTGVLGIPDSVAVGVALLTVILADTESDQFPWLSRTRNEMTWLPTVSSRADFEKLALVSRIPSLLERHSHPTMKPPLTVPEPWNAMVSAGGWAVVGAIESMRDDGSV